MTEFLTQVGFEVKSASGQTDALTFLEKESFDLVLLDISLSDGNGFSVCSAVKSDYGIPVIFLTASSDEFSRDCYCFTRSFVDKMAEIFVPVVHFL